MNLGPNQKEWIAALRAHPERQCKSELGNLLPTKNGSIRYKACCLGEALLVLNGRDIDRVSKRNMIVDIDKNNNNYYDISCMIFSHNEMGLRDGAGTLNLEKITEKYQWISENFISSLVDLNDDHMTWNEIADFMEECPEAVFVESK